ncbi:MAG TPA: potassium transporter Kup [Alphaproteobacteria bacterium]|nr:potassium transporter Kup [Alphaproteobacteria bacterium]
MAQLTAEESAGNRSKAQQGLILGALGVVYGDIGTSPLYTVKQCFDAGTAVSRESVLGVLSLIAWALIIVVALKYVVVIMRADNRGEGGILALTALALRTASRRGRRHRLILAAGLVGAALFYGDGVITPAISVLSAVEGLKVATPLFDSYVIPITVLLLLALFLIQRRGTARVGSLFGPVMALWFISIGVLGAVELAVQPTILLALNPLHGLRLLLADPWRGFILLGAVVLAVTGAEALYADMGHFGRAPIRATWFWIVFPCLLLNYFGQGALLLRTPEALDNPFYRLAPPWALYPLVVLSSMATVIASQAVISGAFSMTRQAVQLGYLPRLNIRHTSAEEAGQIFVPTANFFLLVAVIALVLGFKSSSNLGWAYGIAVTGTMSLTTMLACVYMVGVAGWSPLVAVPLFGFLLTVDLCFFAANMLKVEQGGWFPLLVATLLYILMSSWMRGRAVLFAQRGKNALPLDTFLKSIRPGHPERVPGTAIFMTGNIDQVPAAMLHNLKHNKVLHERVVLMTVQTEDIPRVPEEQRIEIRHLDHNFHTITVRYGFMEEPNIPRALAQCRVLQFRFNLMETSFFVGREKILKAKRSPLSRWRQEIFILLSNTMLSVTDFFHIPSNRVIELGGQIEV